MAYVTLNSIYRLLLDFAAQTADTLDAIQQDIQTMSGTLDTDLANLGTSLDGATGSLTKLNTDVQALIAKQQSGTLTPEETQALATLQQKMDAHKAAVDALDATVASAAGSGTQASGTPPAAPTPPSGP